MKHLLRKYEAKRADYFRRKHHDAKHRFTCVANFMRRKARFIEKDRLQKQSVFFWWGRTDSNHRSDTQQIYSLSPLATRELPQLFSWLFSTNFDIISRISDLSRGFWNLFLMRNISLRKSECKAFGLFWQLSRLRNRNFCHAFYFR